MAMHHRARGLNTGDGGVQQIDTGRLFVCIGGAPNTEASDTNIVRDRAVKAHENVRTQDRHGRRLTKR